MQYGTFLKVGVVSDVTLSLSARTTALNQTLEPLPMVTLPMIEALGATNVS